MKTAEQRLNNIIGQLNVAKKMLSEENGDCFAVLTQFKAARSALSSLMDQIISQELANCLAMRQPERREKITAIFKEVLKK